MYGIWIAFVFVCACLEKSFVLFVDSAELSNFGK